jgi:hypothetical protein
VQSLGLAILLTLGVAGAVTATRKAGGTPAAPVVLPAAQEAPVSIGRGLSTRRAQPLPPGRPRRNSPAQLPGAVLEPVVPERSQATSGRVDLPGSRPDEDTARQAVFLVAQQLCADVSTMRPRQLREDPTWRDVTYYVRKYEARPPDGSFVVRLQWNGSGYDTRVTGAAGDCR